jgi:glucoamylase
LTRAEVFEAPGAPPTWSWSDKDYVTTALDGARLCATVGHGIINEVYWATTGDRQIRDWGFYRSVKDDGSKYLL